MFFVSENRVNKSVVVRQRVDIPVGRHVATFCSFSNFPDQKEHVALVFKGDSDQSPLVRVHSECLTGDVFSSGRCDCGEQLSEAIERIASEGGILLYLRQEGRGIGLYRKLEAYELQLQGQDTYEANRSLGLPDDLREYKVAADMLHALGVKTIRLLSNNPDKKRQLEDHGIDVESMHSTGVFLKEFNTSYLKAKVQKTGHRIDLGTVS